MKKPVMEKLVVWEPIFTAILWGHIITMIMALFCEYYIRTNNQLYILFTVLLLSDLLTSTNIMLLLADASGNR